MKNLSWQIDSRSAIGGRQFQEDAHAVASWRVPAEKEKLGVVVAVADGMGGYTGGAAAARTAVTVALDVFLGLSGDVTEKLRIACHKANEAVALAKGGAGDEYAKMGCTLVLFCLYSNCIQWVSVGDSVLWILRKNSLIRLNADHSMRSQIQRQNPSGKPGSNSKTPSRSGNMLLSALTGEALQKVDESGDPVLLQREDLVIAATDGILALEESEIADNYSSSSTLDSFLDRLVDKVEKKAGNLMDNTTIVVCQAN